jgi:hypothetical protein
MRRHAKYNGKDDKTTTFLKGWIRFKLALFMNQYESTIRNNNTDYNIIFV